MTVSAIIVTRGDVDLMPILLSLPKEWPTFVWDNGMKRVRMRNGRDLSFEYFDDVDDLSVYGRYAAIEYTNTDLIYTQDDDCIVSDPAELVSKWVGTATLAGPVSADGSDLSNIEIGNHVVCNMPPEFRHDFYTEHALVGFGAVFHRDAPFRAFNQMGEMDARNFTPDNPFFLHTCDIVFTALTPRVLVDVPKTNLWWAEDDARMYRHPEHQAERARMLDLVQQVKSTPMKEE